jgi:deazaflavin-dependent oxidoreductase (nitroreductase family)
LSDRFVVWLSTSAGITWIIRHVASRLDPWLFRASNGRFTTMGVPSMPMLTLTATGRKSGKARSVHLACLQEGNDYLVIASAMGQKRHPGWRYNLDAHPDIEVQVLGRRFAARAAALTGPEKAAVWPKVHQAIPQMKVYEERTPRNIRVYRLSPAGE